MKKILMIFVVMFCVDMVLLSQDKGTLDLLVSKGLLSREDADTVSKKEVAVTTMKSLSDTKRMSISCIVDYNYIYGRTTTSDVKATLDEADLSGFSLRRIFVWFAGDLGSGWKSNVILDMARSSTPNANYLEQVFVTKDVDYNYLSGTAAIGYKKVNFCYEENLLGIYLMQMERTVVSRYFSDPQVAGTGNMGFGARYTGLFWDGKVKQVEGLSYGMAVTNPVNYSIRPVTSKEFSNSVSLWANVVYGDRVDIGGDDYIKYKVGFNFGYANEGVSKLKTDINASAPTSFGNMIGMNPYFVMEYKSMTFWAEFLASNMENGRSGGTETAMPIGTNVVFEYRFDIGEYGQVAPTFRFSYLNTDGRGYRLGDNAYGSQNLYDGGSSLNFYNDAISYFVGFNWYIMGESLKWQIGYSWLEASGMATSVPNYYRRTAYNNTILTQFQMIF